LQNEDGRARGSLGTVYQNLSYDEIKPLLPAIHRAIVEPAPSGIMFADEIRLEGLRILAKHRVKEGIDACVHYTRTQNPWASEKRTPELMKILLGYGAHAKSTVPELEQIADYFENDEEDFPRNLGLKKATVIRETIRAIKASDEYPELIYIEQTISLDLAGRKLTLGRACAIPPDCWAVLLNSPIPIILCTHCIAADVDGHCKSVWVPRDKRPAGPNSHPCP
jgi:hypothetical protein